MPTDYKKKFLEEENKTLKIEMELNSMKKEVELLRKNQSVMNNFSSQQNQNQNQQQLQQPISKTFEKDVKYIVELSQRMTTLLKECRRQMLPMDLGKKIDAVLREIDRM